jgi:outer membrane biosynthesis protein TonB
MRPREIFVLLLAAAFGAAGCGTKHIVRAAPPSVSIPPPQEAPPLQPPPTPPAAETKTEEPPPEAPPPEEPPPAPAKRPAPRPRPAQPETADPAPPKPAPPQISPQLSPKDLATAQSNTRSNIKTAEDNLQLASGKQLSLSAAQKDLVEKISGFLSQAHEAIIADDWVRAQNLAEKAGVLSSELVKSLK